MNTLALRLITCLIYMLSLQPTIAESLLSSNDLQQAAVLRDQSLKSNPAFSIVESLTSEVGPRMGGSAGDQQAVDWAVQKFKALGFDKIWTEAVTFPTWKREIEFAEIRSPVKQTLAITALGNSISTPEQGMDAEIIHFKTFAELESADAEKVKNKIVFISNRMERTKDGSGYGKAVIARFKGSSMAARKGAVAIVIRSIGTDNNRLPHTGIMKYDEDVNKIPAAAISNPDADLLENLLKRQTSVILHLQLRCGPGEPYTSANVIGEIQGAERPNEIVLLGAHLDSWDLGTGAIDDGAGVAIVMAAAYQISQLDKRPNRTIRVILYANEEQGVFGGDAYATQHSSNNEKHIAAVESDLGAGRIWKIASTVDSKSLKRVKQIAKVLKPLGIQYDNHTAHAGADIQALGKKGVPLFELAQDANLYFDYHHTANDTLDKIDPEALSQNVAAYVVLAYLAAQTSEPF